MASERMRLSFRTIFWALAALIVVVGLALAFRPESVAVDLAQVRRGPMTVTVRDEARTRARDVYDVAAPVDGYLLRIDKEAGDHVRAGDVVARLLPGVPPFLDARTAAEASAAIRAEEAALASARSDTERAQAELALAQAEARRLEALFAGGLVAQGELDRARTALSVAQAASRAATEAVRTREAVLEAARTRLIQPGAPGGNAGIAIVAPATGRILRVERESESFVVAGTRLLALGDPGDLEVVAEFLSSDAVQITPGATAWLDNWGGAAPRRGRVRLVEPYGFLKISALGVEEQRVNVIIDLDAPRSDWAALGHGYRLEAAVVTWEEDDVVQAPVAALFRKGTQWAVFRVESGRAVTTPVEVGRANGREAQILSGLEPGATIILYPGENIDDNTRVHLRE